MMAVDELCRTCAEKNNNMIEIFGEEGRDRKIAEKINFNLPIKVYPNDELPLKMCLRCVLWLETAQELRTSCLSADTVLKIMMGINLESNESTHNDDRDSIGQADMLDSDTMTDVEDSFKEEISWSKNVEAIQEWSSKALKSLATNMGLSNMDSLFTIKKQVIKDDQFRVKMPNFYMAPPPFRCDECDLDLATYKIVQNHHQVAHNRNLVTCTNCYVFFSTNRELREHIQELHPKFTFEIQRLPPSASTKPRVHVSQEKAKKIMGVNKKIVKKIKIKKKRVKTKRTCQHCKQHFPLEDFEGYKKHMQEHRKQICEEKLKHSTLQCDYCEMKFLRVLSKETHMRMKHKEYKPYTCDYCSRKFREKSILKAHIGGIHQKIYSFLCSVCGKSFSQKTYLTHHSRIHDNRIQCQYCPGSFVSRNLNGHMRRHYKCRIYQCSQCGTSFFTADKLKEHMSSHFVSVFQCCICGYCFSTESILQKHNNVHKDPDTQCYICPVKSCCMQFMTRDETANHCKLHSKEEQVYIARSYDQSIKNKNLSCSQCSQMFRHMSVYLNHMISHYPEKNETMILNCGICEQEFTDERSLTKHLETHPQALDFQCRHCTDKFVTDTSRNNHEGIVHGGKTQCTTCFKIFANMSKLRDHERKHTGLRPYICELCGKGFFSSKDRANHRRLHSNTRRLFICQFCNKECYTRNELSKHLAKHTNEKMFKCSICPYSSNSRKEVTLHVAAEHADEVDSDSD